MLCQREFAATHRENVPHSAFWWAAGMPWSWDACSGTLLLRIDGITRPSLSARELHNALLAVIAKTDRYVAFGGRLSRAAARGGR